MRDRLLRLSGLNIGSKVLEIYRANIFDLELLAIAEDETREKPPGAEEQERTEE